MPQTHASADPHVAVLVFPFAAHAAALLAVVRRLAAASPNTHFTFFSTAKSNNSIFSSHDDDDSTNIHAYDVSDGVPDGYTFVGKPQEDIVLFMEAAPESFRRGVEAAVAETGRRVSCLVTDAFLWFGAEMAEEMGVPWVPCWTSGANSLSIHIYTDLIRDTIGLEGVKGREDETLQFIPGMSRVLIRDLPEGVLFGNLESLFSNMLHQMGLVLPRAAAVFINSFEELEPTITNDLKSKFNKLLCVGPFNLLSSPPQPQNPNSDSYILSWLDKQKHASVAYISFGTVAVPPPNELAAVAEALEASGVPFIWSLRDNAKIHLSKSFLDRTRENGLVVPWAPQRDILEHAAVGAFVTHAGWNSVLETIPGQVPMICRPFFGDHRINARMVEQVWEIGLITEGGVFTKQGLIRDLEKILSQEQGKKVKARIMALKEQAHKAIGPKGSSTSNFNTLVHLISTTKV